MSSRKGSIYSRFSTTSTLRELEDRPIAVPRRPTHQEVYPNFETSFFRIAIVLIPAMCLFLLLAINPSRTTGMISVGTEHVGAIRFCEGGTCQGWMQGVGNYSPPSPVIPVEGQTTLESTTPDNTNPVQGTTTNPVKRATTSLADSINTESFFLTTGTAILLSFYISIFLVVCFIIRFFTPPEPPPKDDPDFSDEIVKTRKRARLKVFAYRASRAMSVVLVVVLFGALISSGMAIREARDKMGLKGSDGIGGGLLWLLLAFILSAYSCLRDLSRPAGRTRIWLGLRCWFPIKLCGRKRSELPKDTLPVASPRQRLSSNPSQPAQEFEMSKRDRQLVLPPLPQKAVRRHGDRYHDPPDQGHRSKKGVRNTGEKF